MQHIRSRPVPGGAHFSCTVCGQAALVMAPWQAQHFAQAHAHPYGLGDMVQRATSAMGIQPCEPCEERKRMMNGWAPNVWPRR
jgi:hypothetical protein